VDDYLAKPFFVEELIARLLALQRYVCVERQNILAVGDLRLDRITREVHWHGTAVDLTGREFNLIETGIGTRTDPGAGGNRDRHAMRRRWPPSPPASPKRSGPVQPAGASVWPRPRSPDWPSGSTWP
jgi:hypothetical protein